MTIYFKVPSDLQIINRLLEVLNVGNNHKYEASKGLISISSKNINKERLMQLANYIRSSIQREVHESGPINIGTFNVENKIKTKYSNTPIKYQITKTVIDYENNIITSYANISSRNIDDIVADILCKAIFDNNDEQPVTVDSIPKPVREIAVQLGVSEDEMAEAAQTFKEIMDIFDSSK